MINLPRKLLLSVLFIIFLNSFGCASYKPPVYDAGKVSNPTVGFNGYSLILPDSIRVVDDKSLSVYRQMFTNRIKQDDLDIQFTDFFVFKTQDEQITIYFGVIGLKIFGSISLYEEEEKEWFLNSMALEWAMMGAKLLEHVEVNGRKWAITEQTKQNVHARTYLALGGLNEIFFLEGLLHKERLTNQDKERLLKLMDQTINNLKF